MFYVLRSTFNVRDLQIFFIFDIYAMGHWSWVIGGWSVYQPSIISNPFSDLVNFFPQVWHVRFSDNLSPHIHIYPICLAGLPTTRAWSGKSLVTTAPAPNRPVLGGQKPEVREQRSENRKQRTENREQRSENRGQKVRGRGLVIA